MTILQQHLAENMKLLRKKLGLSQARLAEKIGTATNYIAMIETGKQFPSPKMIEKIALALEVPSPELFSKTAVEQKAFNQMRYEILADIGSMISEKLKI